MQQVTFQRFEDKTYIAVSAPIDDLRTVQLPDVSECQNLRQMVLCVRDETGIQKLRHHLCAFPTGCLANLALRLRVSNRVLSSANTRRCGGEMAPGAEYGTGTVELWGSYDVCGVIITNLWNGLKFVIDSNSVTHRVRRWILFREILWEQKWGSPTLVLIMWCLFYQRRADLLMMPIKVARFLRRSVPILVYLPTNRLIRLLFRL